MNIYLMFEDLDLTQLKGNGAQLSKSIKDVAGKWLNAEPKVAVHFYGAKNLAAPITIIIDWLPKPSLFSLMKRQEMLDGFKSEVSALLAATLPSLADKRCIITADPDYSAAAAAQAQDKGAAEEGAASQEESEFDYRKKAELYQATEPAYTFERVILPAAVHEKIEEALNIIQYEQKVFGEWGLYVIEPHPSSSLSFYGPSGTGKTMAAEAIAQKLGKKVLKVSYADIESKFHGEGPKMVKAIFIAAARDDAVLFIDEADSLLSKRLTNVTQGSEQAINSMRSQLLICLEEFKGIVIFATNLVVNYDQAFLTRLISVEFVLPDAECRAKIWDVHIRGNGIKIPLAADVNVEDLANEYEFCGRQIRKAVIAACVSVAMRGAESVAQADFSNACAKIVEEEELLRKAKDHTKQGASGNVEINDITKDLIKQTIKSKRGAGCGETRVAGNEGMTRY